MSNESDDDFERKAQLLIRAAELLHRYGTPSHRLEGVMTRVSRAIGVDADYLYTPTSLFVSFHRDRRRVQLMRVDAGPIDLGKLAEFDESLERVEHHECALGDSALELENIEARTRRFGNVWLAAATGIASACAAIFLGGGIPEAITALVLGLCVYLMGLALNWLAPGERLIEVLSGFTCATLSLLAASLLHPIDDRIATLGALIVLLPGLSVTIAMTELANRHLSSGVSRLAGAGVVFLSLAVGVALAWSLWSGMRADKPEIAEAGGALRILAVFIAPFAFLVLFQARPSDWIRACAVAWLGYAAADMAHDAGGAEWGAFSGAAVVGLLANLDARWRNRPALILQMPAMVMLVPGSLGYLSVTAFIDKKGIQGIETAFSMAIVAAALAGGLVVANALIPPRRYL